MMRRVFIGVVSGTLVVLAARSLAYAAEPSASARFLAQRAGGPSFPALALAVLTFAFALAVAVCWLAALAVRERASIERRAAEPFGVARALAAALALTVVTSFAGGLLEAYIHWRAGLGWHGLHCLLGPVHRDLLPFESGLSFVAASILAAARHVAAWMRRTFARLAAQLPPVPFSDSSTFPVAVALTTSARGGAASARAPPLPG
jgi:hypothetical protein